MMHGEEVSNFKKTIQVLRIYLLTINRPFYVTDFEVKIEFILFELICTQAAQHLIAFTLVCIGR